MKYIGIRCTNPQCDFYESKIKLLEGVALFDCPLCGSKMVSAETGEKPKDSSAPVHWLEEIALDPALWIPDAENAYPAVIAYEYGRLRNLCREKKPYAVLLCLKDNYETLLKFETLLAFAWVSRKFEGPVGALMVGELTAPIATAQRWPKLASGLVKNLRKAGGQLPVPYRWSS